MYVKKMPSIICRTITYQEIKSLGKKKEKKKRKNLCSSVNMTNNFILYYKGKYT